MATKKKRKKAVARTNKVSKAKVEAAKKKPARVRAKKPTRAKKQSGTAMFQRVAFTLFTVQNAMRARAFYELVLGLERGLASPDGTWTEYDLPGGGCLALFRHPDASAARPSGGASVAFEVADLDALNARLTEAGVVYEGDMVHGPHCRMSNIRDSEGNALILHELAPKKRGRSRRG